MHAGLRRANSEGVLTRRQRLLSALSLALLPYILSRAEKAFLRLSGTGEARNAESQSDEQELAVESAQAARRLAAASTPQRALLRVFPWAHGCAEL